MERVATARPSGIAAASRRLQSRRDLAHLSTAEIARPLNALHATTMHAAVPKPVSSPASAAGASDFLMYAPSALKPTPHT